MMSIDWKAEVEKRQDEYLEDLFTLLRVNSVRDDEHASEEEPVGPGPRKALDTFLEIAERDGFITKNVDNLAGRVEFGEGDETLGILGHVDVVPVDKYWETDPFEPVIKDGNLYARGASDDKGPTMAAYYALKIIRDLDLPLKKKVHFIVGTDEESGWMCMDRYFKTEPMPDLGFSPDATFPIINGEKGQYTVYLDFTDRDETLVQFTAGQRENMVPAEAKAQLKGVALADLKAEAEAYNDEEPVEITLEESDGMVLVQAKGKAAHGSNPQHGENAATHLARFLLKAVPALKENKFLRFQAEKLHGDYFGKETGVDHHDDVMGDLTLNPGVIHWLEGYPQIVINMRVPRGISYGDIGEKFDSLGETYGFKRTDSDGNRDPHYVSGDDPLVKTLLAAYEDQTGEKGYEQVIGGGTYGRLFERGVAYGAMFPDTPDTMHQANEYARLDDLFTAMAIYADAIYRLISE